MTDEKLEQLLKQALYQPINDKDITVKVKENKMKLLSARKIVAAVAVVCILGGTGAFAAGHISQLISGEEKVYKQYTQMESVQKKAGFDVKSVESFGDGFKFKEASIINTKKADDDGNVLGSYKEIGIYYQNQSHGQVSLYMFEEENYMAGESKHLETKNINGVEVEVQKQKYKFVPTDYKLTAEDKEAQKDGSIEISYGTDKVEEEEIGFVTWSQDNIIYEIVVTLGDTTMEDAFALCKALTK